MTGGITNAVLLEPNNKVLNMSTNRLSLSFTVATGAFKGSVVDPATQKPISFGGVVLQKQNVGYGFFLGANQSGQVRLGP